MSDVHGAEDSSSEDAPTEELVPPEQEMVPVPQTSAAVEKAKDTVARWRQARERVEQARGRANARNWEEFQAVANRAVVEELDQAAGHEVEHRTDDQMLQLLRLPTRQRERGIASGIADGKSPFQMPVIIRASPANIHAAANAAEAWLDRRERVDQRILRATLRREAEDRVRQKPLPTPPKK